MKTIKSVGKIGVLSCLILLISLSGIVTNIGSSLLVELGVVPDGRNSDSMGSQEVSSQSSRQSGFVSTIKFITPSNSLNDESARRHQLFWSRSQSGENPAFSLTDAENNHHRPNDVDAAKAGTRTRTTSFLESSALSTSFVEGSDRYLAQGGLQQGQGSGLQKTAGTIFISQIIDIGSGLKKIVVTTDFDARLVELRIGNATFGYWPWIDITASRAQVGSFWEYEYIFNATALAEGNWSVQARARDAASTLYYSSVKWFLVDYVSQKILLVDDDENYKGHDYVAYYHQVLQALGYRRSIHYDNFTTTAGGSGPPLSVLQNYDLVIWFTGYDYVNTLTATDRSNLQSYLNNGGHLWIIGQDIGFDLLDTSYSANYDPIFYEKVLKASNTSWYDLPQAYGGTPYGLPANELLPISGLGPFSGLSYTLKNVDDAIAKYPDEILATGGATNLLYYSSSTDSPNNAALWYDGTYQLLYFSFNFEAIAIHDLTGAVDLANRSLNLFSVGYSKPPTINIQAPTNGTLIDSSSVTLTWTATDVDSTILTYRIYVDGNYVGQTQSTSYSLSLSDGIHYISVKVIDDTGQEAVDFLVVDVDTQAPSFLLIPNDLQYAEGASFSSSHLLKWNVSDAHPTSYELYINGILNQSGTWTQSVWQYVFNASGLSLGSYNFTFVVKDSTNRISVDMVWVTVYDGTPPSIVGVSSRSIIEGITGKTVNWTARDAHPTTYQIYMDGSQVKSGTWTDGEVLFASLDGLSWRSYPYNFTIVVKDVGGNVVKSTTFVSVLDVIAPFINSAPSSPFSYAEGSTGNTLSWNSSDLHPDSYTIYRNGTTVSSGSWSSNSLISISIDGLSLGKYNFTILISDLSGNVNVSTVWVTVHDATPPDVVSSGDLTYKSGTTGNVIYWNVTELHPSNYTILYSNSTFSGVKKQGNLNSTSESIVLNVDGLALGETHNFTLIVQDQSNNRAIVTILVTVIDATNPLIILTTHVNLSIIGPSTTLQFNLTDDSSLNHTFYRWDNPNVLGGTSIALGGVTSYVLSLSPPSVSSSGWHDLYLYVNDSQNNNFSLHYRFYIDVDGPTILGISPLNDSFLSAGKIITLTFEDDVSLSMVEYYWNGTRTEMLNPSNTITINAPTVEGVHLLLINVKDNLGNWRNGTKFWFYIDQGKPQQQQITFIYGDPPKDNDPTIGIKANITDSGAGVSTVYFEIYVNGTLTYNVTASHVEGWWVWIPGSPFQLSAGTNLTVVIHALDAVIGTPNELTTTRQWIIQDHDVAPPVISVFTYQEGTNVENQNLTVKLSATDDIRGIKQVVVSYQIKGTGTWTNVTASYNNDSGFYVAILPQFPSNKTIQVKAYVFDKSLNENVATSNTIEIFITDSDFSAPVVVSAFPYPNSDYDNTTLVIVTTVTDSGKGVKWVIVSYRTGGDSTWNNVTATLVNGSWTASIGTFSVGTRIYIKIYAQDDSLNANAVAFTLSNPVVIKESDLSPPTILDISYKNQTNYEGLNLQVLVNVTDGPTGKGIEMVIVSYKTRTSISESSWQNVTAYYSALDGLYIAYLPTFTANTIVYVKAFVKDSSTAENWAVSQEIEVIIHENTSGNNQNKESVLLDSSLVNASFQTVIYEENLTFWLVWGYTAGGKISYIETSNVTYTLLIGSFSNQTFIPDPSQNANSSIVSITYLDDGNYSLTFRAKDLEKAVLVMIHLNKNGFIPLTYVLAIQVVPRVASFRLVSAPYEFRLGTEPSVVFGWVDQVNGSWVSQDVQVSLYLNDTLLVNLSSRGLVLEGINQLIPINVVGWNLTFLLDPDLGWLRGNYNLTIVIQKYGYLTTVYTFNFEVKGYAVTLSVTYPEEFTTGEDVNISVQLVLNSTTSNDFSTLAFLTLEDVNVSISVSLLYQDGTSYTWNDWAYTDVSGKVIFTIPGTVTRGLYAISQITVSTPGNNFLDVSTSGISTPPIRIIPGNDDLGDGQDLQPELPQDAGDTSSLDPTELIPLLTILLLPVLGLLFLYLRSRRRKRAEKDVRKQWERRRARGGRSRRGFDPTLPLTEAMHVATAQTESSSRIHADEHDSVTSAVRQEPTTPTASSDQSLPSITITPIDPIALERVLDFLEIAGWLLVMPDGSLVGGTMTPTFPTRLNLENLAALCGFTPLSLGSPYEVEMRRSGELTLVLTTGELFRLVLLFSSDVRNLSPWLSDAMGAALEELEKHVREISLTQQMDPYQVIRNLSREMIVYTLESYLPLQLIYPLVLDKARMTQIVENIDDLGIPRYLADGWKILILYHYLSNYLPAEEIAFSLANESSEGLTRIFREDIPMSFAPKMTLHELWEILTKFLHFPEKTAAEIIIEGLKYEILRGEV